MRPSDRWVIRFNSLHSAKVHNEIVSMNRKQRRTAAKLGQTASHASGDKAAALAPAGAADLLTAGVKLHQAGRLAEAEGCYRRILAAQPSHTDALYLLGLLAHQTGRNDSAVELIRQAIQRNANNPNYFSQLGLVLYILGRLDEAVVAYRRAISIKPDYAEVYCNLGNALKGQGNRDEAIAAYRQAISIKPELAEAHTNLGVALNERGDLDAAVVAYRRAISIRPDLAEAYCNLGNALKESGKSDEALAAYRQAIAIKPDYVEAHSNLGLALTERGDLDEAILTLRRTINIKPEFAEVYYFLGNALKEQGRRDEASAAYRQAISLKPNYAEPHANLGIVLSEQGNVDAAIAAYRQAICIKPDNAEVHSNLLLCLNYDDKLTADNVFAAHREWDERYGSHASRPSAYANAREPKRRLRIGYVSPDFRAHSVAFFLEPLLRAHDHAAVEVFCYSEVARPDAVTQHLQGFADHWLVTVGMSDDALAQRISEDRIDILIDLAGHTAKNRLRVFARKPAPVQATWLGYANTTGLEAIDYRLVDAVTDPEGTSDALASERLIRLEGGFLCYAPAAIAPLPAPPPSLASGVVTFGSFNNPLKLSAVTLDCWAALLTRRPTARLLLKGRQFDDAATGALFLARLGERGVAAERVELMPQLPGAAAHLSAYHRVDIALDPFPYNGTTTTCEALWMGVPVVVRRGDRHAGRVGVSLLGQIGLTDLIAGSAEEYVEIALALADDLGRRNELRQSLRPRLAASPLCDVGAFARKMEAAFRSMWQHWCEKPITRA
jgi:protein O-GlcNAc transferase